MRRSAAATSRLSVLLVGWTLFVFAHSYRLTIIPLACGIAVLAAITFKTHVWGPPSGGPIRPKPDPTQTRLSTRFLDVAVILTIAAIALQLVPLPEGLRGRLSPAGLHYDSALRFGVSSTGRWRPISIDPNATALALVVVMAIGLLFWSLRTLFQRGGVRAVIRGIAWIGLVLSPLAIVHHVKPLPIIDLAWGVTSRNLRAYGPFVNRNDFAGWLIMAIPLTIGYVIARLQSRHRKDEPFDPDMAFDSKSIWLGTAVCLMLAGLLFSTSRSGLLGGFIGLVCFAWVSRRHLTAKRAGLAIIGLAVALAVASAYADIGTLSGRFLNATLTDDVSARLSIWRQTWPVIRDFWPFGSGAGTYQSIMVLYQTMSRYFYITHADNEFLQVLAEGGLLLGLPIAMALVAGLALVRKRLRNDRTAIFWLRAGAASGIVAVAAQNMVEMTLRIPANAVLFAILAAVAVHDGDA